MVEIYNIGIVIYMLIMLGVSVWASKHIKNATDFIVAKRKLSLKLVTASIFATWFGGATILGISGRAFYSGDYYPFSLWSILVDPFGATLCLIIAGFFYMGVMRKMELLTLADFFGIRFGRKTEVISALLMIPTYIFWLGTQFVVFGKIFQVLLGWNYTEAVILSALVTLVYTVIGGFLADCITDFIQAIILCIGLAIIVPLTINAAGGIDAIVAYAPPQSFQFLPANSWSSYIGVDDLYYVGILEWIALWLVIGIGGIPTPDLMERAFGSNDEKTAKNAAIVGGVMYIVTAMMVVVIGISGWALINNGIIDANAINPALNANADPELLIPLVAKTILPPFWGMIFFGALLGIVMSSADSALLAPSTVLAKNIYRDLFRPFASDKEFLAIARISVIAIALCSLYVSIGFPYAYALVVIAFDIILACLFVPLTLGIYWKKANSIGAVAGIISGAVFRLSGGYSTADGVLMPSLIGVDYYTYWYYFTIFSPIVSFIFMVIFSYLTQNIDPPKELRSNSGLKV